MSSSFPIQYITISNVINELGLTTDQNGNYLIWQIATAPSVINNYVNQANIFTTSLWGDLSSSPQNYALAQLYAQKWAALRLVEELAINWQTSGIHASLGNIGIDRLQALQAAMVATSQRLKEDLTRIYMLLADIDTGWVDNYRPTSPYIVTGGSPMWV